MNILPISKKFDLNDLVFFHKIINGFLETKLPDYVSKFTGESRLRNNHLDTECYVCTINHSTNSSRSPIYRNFFYRVTFMWNKLSYEVRSDPNINTFKSSVIDFLWSEAFWELH